MDRTLISPGEYTRDYDFQKALSDAMKGLAYTTQDALGSTVTVVGGLAATPTSPASLTVNVAPGRVMQLAQADATADGSITAADTTQIMQQGIIAAVSGQAYAQQFTLVPPATAGQNQWALIEAIFNQADGVRPDDPTSGNIAFYNPSNANQPTISSVNTVRHGQCLLSVLYGSPAAAGSEVPPNPSAGAVGLYLIDLSNGQTTITSGEILVAGPSVGTGVPNNYPVAPFLAGLLNSHHSGNAGQAPQIKLTSEVQGILAVANGGTGGATGENALAALGAPFASQYNVVVTAHTAVTTDFGSVLRATLTNTTITIPSTLGSGSPPSPVFSIKGYSDGTTIALASGTTFGGGEYDGLTSITLAPNEILTFSIAAAGSIQVVSAVGVKGRLVGAPQKFTANGTYTPTAGALNAHVKGVGGGGAGNAAGPVTSGDVQVAGGGGSGTEGEFWISCSAIAGASVIIGIGGTGGGNGSATTVGSVITFPGGGGGIQGTATSGLGGGEGGAIGAVASTTSGLFLSSTAKRGVAGVSLNSASDGLWGGGEGAGTRFGAGGAGAGAGPGGVNGSAAPSNSGGGGGGAASIATTGTATGGAGGSGYLEIWEYS